MCSHSLFLVAARTGPVDKEERPLADSALLAQSLRAVGGTGKGECWIGKLAASTSEAPLKCMAQWGVDCFVRAAEAHLMEALKKEASPAIRLADPSRNQGIRMDSEDRRNLTESQHGSN